LERVLGIGDSCICFVPGSCTRHPPLITDWSIRITATTSFEVRAVQTTNCNIKQINKQNMVYSAHQVDKILLAINCGVRSFRSCDAVTLETRLFQKKKKKKKSSVIPKASPYGKPQISTYCTTPEARSSKKDRSLEKYKRISTCQGRSLITCLSPILDDLEIRNRRAVSQAT
jgi:hypothetical protein